MKGILALDIDGTLTKEVHSMPHEVAQFLDETQKKGWRLLFITGRNFPWSYSVLKQLSVPYFLAIQNGATLLEMPSRNVLGHIYLQRSVFLELDQISKEEKTDFIIYSGYEFQDICYYRPQNFSPEILTYLNRRKDILKENWVMLDDFSEIKEFASLKYIGKEASIRKIIEKVEQRLNLHMPLNRDPFDQDYFVAQATNPLATKGNVLKNCIALLKPEGPTIAAGDDYNDVSMLELAQIRIVMGDAPKDLLALADVVASPASEMGIIEGIKKAMVLGLLKGE